MPYVVLPQGFEVFGAVAIGAGLLSVSLADYYKSRAAAGANPRPLSASSRHLHSYDALPYVPSRNCELLALRWVLALSNAHRRAHYKFANARGTDTNSHANTRAHTHTRTSTQTPAHAHTQHPPNQTRAHTHSHAYTH